MSPAAPAAVRRSLEALEDGVVFDLYPYSDRVEAVFREPVEMSRRNRAQALKALENLPLTGYRDLWRGR